MAKLKVPSAQHLARNWQASPAAVQKELVKLVDNPPTFSYQAMLGFVRDMLVLGVPEAQIKLAILRKVKRPDVQANFLELLPLVAGHFSAVSPLYVNGVERRYYAAGRGLMVPFDPPIVYGTARGMVFPWLSFWKSNPLGGERLSLFVTMVRDLLEEDPDLELADFQILDFSAPKRSSIRDLTVIAASEIPLLTTERKNEMLAIFAEGYFGAAEELKSRPASKGKETPPAEQDQPGLFD